MEGRGGDDGLEEDGEALTAVKGVVRTGEMGGATGRCEDMGLFTRVIVTPKHWFESCGMQELLWIAELCNGH